MTGMAVSGRVTGSVNKVPGYSPQAEHCSGVWTSQTLLFGNSTGTHTFSACPEKAPVVSGVGKKLQRLKCCPRACGYMLSLT